MTTTTMTLQQIEALAIATLKANGWMMTMPMRLQISSHVQNEMALPHMAYSACQSYVKSMKSGKVNGTARPVIEQSLPALISVDGNHGYTPQAWNVPCLCLPKRPLKQALPRCAFIIVSILPPFGQR